MAEGTRWVAPFEDTLPGYFWHPSFEAKNATTTFDEAAILKSYNGSVKRPSESDCRTLAKCAHFLADRATLADDKREEESCLARRAAIGNLLILSCYGLPKTVCNKFPYVLVDRLQLHSESMLFIIQKWNHWNPWESSNLYSFATFICERRCRCLMNSSPSKLLGRMNEFIPEVNAEPADAPESDHKEMYALVQRCRDVLSPSDFDLVCRYHGLNGFESSTLMKIAAEFGCTFQNIRQKLARIYRELSELIPEYADSLRDDS